MDERRNRRPASRRAWLPADTTLWHTCRIVSELLAGTEPAPVPTVFAPDPGERIWAAGSLAVDSFTTVGDGSYLHQGTTAVFGYGKTGVALTAASVIGGAIGNARRRHAAEHAATPAWHRIIGGSVFVSNHGFRIQDQSGLFAWNWESIDAMEIGAYNLVGLQGRSADGHVTWRLISEWSELIFVLWAMNRHPQHPQLRNGGWLPEGWIRWATEQGYPPPIPSAPVIPPPTTA